MASLFKPTIISYTLPNGKTRTPDGKRVNKDTPGAIRHRRKAKKWYAKYTDADGQEQRPPLSVNKAVAQQMLGALVKRTELGKVGIVDHFEKHRGRPLSEHLVEWQTSLLDDGATAKHVHQTVACVRRILESCKFVFISDLSASPVQSYLAGLREHGKLTTALDPAKEWYTKKELATALGLKGAALTSLVRRHRLKAKGNGKARRYPRATAEALRERRNRGRSIKTSNLYLDGVKAFAAWLVTDRRIDVNALTHLEGGNVKLDRRHDRRALPIEELRGVIASARTSNRAFRGLAGGDRAVLYSVACVSGFRAEELATLRPTAFDLDAATVTLSAENAKNGKTAVQPLPADVAEELQTYLVGRSLDGPIWPGNWFQNAAEMLRIELDACGIPYTVEGPDGPLYADFHALRHSYVALLDKSGATLKEAMQLARHSDPKLTMAVYGRARLNDLTAAVGKLPSLLTGPTSGQQERNALAATGTDPVPAPCTGFVPKIDFACVPLTGLARGEEKTEPPSSDHNPLSLQGVENEQERLSVFEGSSPSRTRTYNKPVNSRLLYH